MAENKIGNWISFYFFFFFHLQFCNNVKTDWLVPMERKNRREIWKMKIVLEIKRPIPIMWFELDLWVDWCAFPLKRMIKINARNA